jgi:hypothetical protein
MYQNSNFSGLQPESLTMLVDPSNEAPVDGLAICDGARIVEGPARGMSGSVSCRNGCFSTCANSGLSALIAQATSLTLSMTFSARSKTRKHLLPLLRQTILVRIPRHVHIPLIDQCLHTAPGRDITPLLRVIVARVAVRLTAAHHLAAGEQDLGVTRWVIDSENEGEEDAVSA